MDENLLTPLPLLLLGTGVFRKFLSVDTKSRE